jgi:hypothetical protein
MENLSIISLRNVLVYDDVSDFRINVYDGFITLEGPNTSECYFYYPLFAALFPKLRSPLGIKNEYIRLFGEEGRSFSHDINRIIHHNRTNFFNNVLGTSVNEDGTSLTEEDASNIITRNPNYMREVLKTFAYQYKTKFHSMEEELIEILDTDELESFDFYNCYWAFDNSPLPENQRDAARQIREYFSNRNHCKVIPYEYRRVKRLAIESFSNDGHRFVREVERMGSFLINREEQLSSVINRFANESGINEPTFNFELLISFLRTRMWLIGKLKNTIIRKEIKFDPVSDEDIDNLSPIEILSNSYNPKTGKQYEPWEINEILSAKPWKLLPEKLQGLPLNLNLFTLVGGAGFMKIIKFKAENLPQDLFKGELLYEFIPILLGINLHIVKIEGGIIVQKTTYSPNEDNKPNPVLQDVVLHETWNGKINLVGSWVNGEFSLNVPFPGKIIREIREEILEIAQEEQGSIGLSPGEIRGGIREEEIIVESEGIPKLPFQPYQGEAVIEPSYKQETEPWAPIRFDQMFSDSPQTDISEAGLNSGAISDVGSPDPLGLRSLSSASSVMEEGEFSAQELQSQIVRDGLSLTPENIIPYMSQPRCCRAARCLMRRR